MYFIGVDLGQKHDYTAIAIVERENSRLIGQPEVYWELPPAPPKLLLRRIERVPLGTPYPRIAERIRAITHEPALSGRCAVAIDGTGVGAPVVDMLREPGLACDLTSVTITGGQRESRSGYLCVSVPRRDLISGIQLAIEKGELRIARRIHESAALLRELLAIRTDSRSPGHDDLVLALALACWRARRKGIWPAGRLPCF